MVDFFSDSPDFMKTLENAGLKSVATPPPPPPPLPDDTVPTFSAQGASDPIINLHVEKNDYMYWEIPGEPISEAICKFSPDVIKLLNELDPENAHKIYHFAAQNVTEEESIITEGYAYCKLNDAANELIDVDDAGLSELLESFSGKRTLVLIHGTGSEAKSAYNPMETLLTQLSTFYGGRILAFNHASLQEDPTTNVAAFLKSVNMVMEARSLDPIQLDLIGHSRGGLVCREIQRQIETDDNLKQKLSVRRIVMVATPNAGTAYLNYDLVGNMLGFLNVLTQVQRYTIGLSNPAFAAGFDSLARFARRLALRKRETLPGIECMVIPENDFLRGLNKFAADNPQIQQTFYALGSNYEGEGNPLAEDGCEMNLRISRVLDSTVIDDLIFKGEANDLVVPTRGTFTSEGTPVEGFKVPDEQYVVYINKGNLPDKHHKMAREPLYHNACNLFRNNMVRQQILDFLIR